MATLHWLLIKVAAASGDTMIKLPVKTESRSAHTMLMGEWGGE